MKSNNSHKITLYMFVFTLVMVIYHTRTDFVSSNEAYQRIGSLVKELFDYLGWMGMAFFFMKSGYLLYRNLSKENVAIKIKSRIFTLLVPLFVWNTIYLVGFMIFDQNRIHASNVLDVVYHYTFAPYDGPLWYVFAIFILALFAPIVVYTQNNKVVISIVCVMALGFSVAVFSFGVLGVFGLSENTHIVMWITRLFRFMPCYILGSVIGICRKDDISVHTISRPIRKCAALLVVITGVVWIVNPDIHNLYKQIVLTVTPILIWLSIDENRFVIINERIVKNAFLIYATHFMFIFVYREIIKRIVPNSIGEGPSLLLWLISPIICVIITYCGCSIFDYLMCKFGMDKMKRILTGSRS